MLDSQQYDLASKDKISPVTDSERPRIARALRNGKRVPVRNIASAANGKTRAVTITHGGTKGSALRRARLDRRTLEGRFEEGLIAQRVLHLGGRDSIAEPLYSVVRHSVRLELLVTLAWAECRRAGVLAAETGALSGAAQAFVSIGRELRGTLEMIGLERRQTEVLDVAGEIARLNLQERHDNP